MKTSQLDKAIAVLEQERQVLDLAIAKLQAQQTAKPAKKTSVKERLKAIELPGRSEVSPG